MFYPYFNTALEELDPDVHQLIQLEAERQRRRIILIPSESASPVAVREALGSTFQNIYAEGYPTEDTRWMSEDEILDYHTHLAFYRRYSGPRDNKGVEYANMVETLARRRCAEAFATDIFSADDIYVNVQALSGAPANNAVFQALLEPGDTVLSMDRPHGGHPSQGSPANRSGKYFNIVPYTINPETGQIDYEAIEKLALEHQPKLIIGGSSSYPWTVDWEKFRSIADLVGAYLLADIAHVAGLVIAGEYPSPLGLAHVITSTTHKSLYGPRGAIIMTTYPKLSSGINKAVFSGEHDGLQVNVHAAMCLIFKYAQSEEFNELQHQAVKNCLALASHLESRGFQIAYGGTNTHLMNLDCTSMAGPDGTPLSGDQAARILDLVGIVVNRNTLPGDDIAHDASGICIGTSWITQCGFGLKETEKLAGLIADLLAACVPYSLTGRKKPIRRVKVDFGVFNDVKIKVRDLAIEAGGDSGTPVYGYPHFYYLDDPLPEEPYTVIELKGEATDELLRWVTSARPCEIGKGEVVDVQLALDKGTVGAVMERVEEVATWRLTMETKDAGRALGWLRDLSDGYVTVDDEDYIKKLPGPVTVCSMGGLMEMPKAKVEADGSDKPWYLGLQVVKGEPLSSFTWDEPETEEIRETALNKTHREMGAKMVPFAGWDMPVWYTSVIEEHNATREAAGLFDVSHMGVYQVEGPAASTFLNSVVTNDVASLQIGVSHYAQFLDPSGAVIDDTMVYRRREDTYLIVVNASNDDKDWTWLKGVKDGQVCVDEHRPWALTFGRECTLRNLRDPAEGEDMRVDIAIQGPKSRDILLSLGCDEATAAHLKALRWAGVMEGVFGGIDLVVSRTGYTGERVAYELFVHPDRSVDLWKALIKSGEPLGMKPVGLGARDSLRTEAGLPLYGHEMAGEMRLGVGDAGFGAYVKTYKPWFIGREAFLAQEKERESEIVRFRFNNKGVRMAHYGDPVVDKRGRTIGVVTSCAVDSDGFLTGQAYLDLKSSKVGTPVFIFQSAPKKASKAPADLSVGDKVSIPTPATVITRFPE
ncbi:MAG: glycine cleavage system aminomethyltransferase GcvT [Anaerolineales bacterium]|nr:MAG: glycine cleavage system aminomethyltransferase GcvT [Anaerolineales bacterium]